MLHAFSLCGIIPQTVTAGAIDPSSSLPDKITPAVHPFRFSLVGHVPSRLGWSGVMNRGVATKNIRILNAVAPIIEAPPWLRNMAARCAGEGFLRPLPEPADEYQTRTTSASSSWPGLERLR